MLPHKRLYKNRWLEEKVFQIIISGMIVGPMTFILTITRSQDMENYRILSNSMSWSYKISLSN